MWRAKDFGGVARPPGDSDLEAPVITSPGEIEGRQPLQARAILERRRPASLVAQCQTVQRAPAAGLQVGLVIHAPLIAEPAGSRPGGTGQRAGGAADTPA